MNEVRKQTGPTFTVSLTLHMPLGWATQLAQLWELPLPPLPAPKSCQVVHNEIAEQPHHREARKFIFSLLITEMSEKARHKIPMLFTSSSGSYFTSKAVTCGCNSTFTILKKILIFSISLTKVEGLFSKSEATSFKEQCCSVLYFHFSITINVTFVFFSFSLA